MASKESRKQRNIEFSLPANCSIYHRTRNMENISYDHDNYFESVDQVNMCPLFTTERNVLAHLSSYLIPVALEGKWRPLQLQYEPGHDSER